MVDVNTPPQPGPDSDTEGYWEANQKGELALCRCSDSSCGLWIHPPLERCRACGGPTTFEPVSGQGTIFSFIVAHQPAVPGYLVDLPYVVAMVELDEQPGLRLVGKVPTSARDEIRIGQRVSVDLVELPGGPHRIPSFVSTTNDGGI